SPSLLWFVSNLLSGPVLLYSSNFSNTSRSTASLSPLAYTHSSGYMHPRAGPRQRKRKALDEKESEGETKRCTCEVRCHGGKSVSLATYKRHEKYRKPASAFKFLVAFPQGLADCSSGDSDSGSSSGDSGNDDDSGISTDKIYDTVPHARRKKLKLDSDESDFLDVEDVSAFLLTEDFEQVDESGRTSPAESEANISDDCGDSGCLDDDQSQMTDDDH
ncbi:hypothetical protein R3P38DRAFT_3481213, partial [Favolaschia claudopus]